MEPRAAGSRSPASASSPRAASARDAFWQACSGRASRRGRSTEIADWDPTPWYDNPKEARRADRVEQFAIAAAAEAFAQAGGTTRSASTRPASARSSPPASAACTRSRSRSRSASRRASGGCRRSSSR